ncbi:putative Endonuclease/exonuclease/phosphatase superfamily [Helianthus annuus]|nr:putative Endonuclease/exonuclease/phosphatase superfamily [Helianthus annuus]
MSMRQELINGQVCYISLQVLLTQYCSFFCLMLKILFYNYSRVVLLGDLNYRISLPERETRLLVNRKDWNTLLENDQYQLNNDEYYGSGHIGTKGKKNRAPAWCDRIIWTGEGLKQLLYTRSETRLSDHRPVKSMFSTEVKVSRMRYQSFCYSDRFGRRPNTNLDFHSDDEYTSHSDRLSFHVKNKMTP